MCVVSLVCQAAIGSRKGNGSPWQTKGKSLKGLDLPILVHHGAGDGMSSPMPLPNLCFKNLKGRPVRPYLGQPLP